MAKAPAPKAAPKAAAKAAPKAAPKAAAKAAPKAAKAAPKKKASEGFMKALQPDEALAKVVGTKPLPRTEVTKLLWEYIKKNKLQAPENKRNINADEKLLPVFGGKKQVTMFEMTKLVGAHLK